MWWIRSAKHRISTARTLGHLVPQATGSKISPSHTLLSIGTYFFQGLAWSVQTLVAWTCFMFRLTTSPRTRQTVETFGEQGRLVLERSASPNLALFMTSAGSLKRCIVPCILAEPSSGVLIPHSKLQNESLKGGTKTNVRNYSSSVRAYMYRCLSLFVP